MEDVEHVSCTMREKHAALERGHLQTSAPKEPHLLNHPSNTERIIAPAQKEIYE